jgi:hypothetical protein
MHFLNLLCVQYDLSFVNRSCEVIVDFDLVKQFIFHLLLKFLSELLCLVNVNRSSDLIGLRPLRSRLRTE